LNRNGKRVSTLVLVCLSSALACRAANADVKPVLVEWLPMSASACSDVALLGETVVLDKSEKDEILWVIHNACGPNKFQLSGLAEEKPVKKCRISPKQSGSSDYKLGDVFELANGQAAVIQCELHNGADTTDYKYHIYIVKSLDNERGPRSHELDIGVQP
jgi:hypothetical protein